MATSNSDLTRGAIAKPRLAVVDQVVRWDAEDSGLVGALVRCSDCDGDGTNWDFDHPKAPKFSAYSVVCEMCSGDGVLLRGYTQPEPSKPSAHYDGDGDRKDLMNDV